MRSGADATVEGKDGQIPIQMLIHRPYEEFRALMKIVEEYHDTLRVVHSIMKWCTSAEVKVRKHDPRIGVLRVVVLQFVIVDDHRVL